MVNELPLADVLALGWEDGGGVQPVTEGAAVVVVRVGVSDFVLSF